MEILGIPPHFPESEKFLESSNNSWNFFSRELLSSHVLRLKIAICGTEIYRLGILEIVQ